MRNRLLKIQVLADHVHHLFGQKNQVENLVHFSLEGFVEHVVQGEGKIRVKVDVEGESQADEFRCGVGVLVKVEVMVFEEFVAALELEI